MTRLIYMSIHMHAPRTHLWRMRIHKPILVLLLRRGSSGSTSGDRLRGVRRHRPTGLVEPTSPIGAASITTTATATAGALAARRVLDDVWPLQVFEDDDVAQLFL